MAIREVELPDGSIAEFPMSMSDETIAKHLSKQFPAPNAPNAPNGQKSSMPVSQATNDLFKPLMSTPTSAMMQAGNAVNQNPTARALAEAEASMLVPPLRLGAPAMSALGRGAQAIGQSIGRIAQGAAVNTAFEGPHAKSPEDYLKNQEHNIGWNAALEAGTFPIRGLSQLHELYNPIKYARDKAGQIKNEMTASRAVMEDMYRPVNEKYNNFPMTVSPKEYLEKAGISRPQLYPRAQKIYDNILKDPSYGNINKLQSQLGADWAKEAGKNAEKEQLFSGMRNTLQDNIQHFLSRDKNALKQYNNARSFGANHYYPYQATPTLRQISRGKVDLEPEKLANSLKTGSEKMIGDMDRHLIPMDHPLRNHLKDLKRRIDIGKFAEFAVPAAGGALAGSLMHPGLSGLLGPLGAGGSVALKASLKKAGMSNFAQNPTMEETFKNVFAPMYYGAGRGAIGRTNE